MNRSLLIDSFKLLALFAGGWLLFTYLPWFQPDNSTFEISVEKEEKLGKILVEDFLLQDDAYQLVSTPALDSAMHIITQRLVDSIGGTDYDYKFYVLRNSEVNAFTMPGGYIFMHTGLIEFSESPEEVAAVLSHEIGHAEKKHVVQKLVKELGLTLLFSVFTGNDPVVLGEISRTAISTIFDRSQEREADEYSFDLMEKSGINPRALAIFFRRVNEKLGGYDKRLEILMTHPHNNSRIKASLEYKTKPGFTAIPFGLDWKAVKASIAEDPEEE
jgi:predicted Zn-dependent protease